MADLRIVDAPEIPTENITGQEKLPTGGSGNYSITLDSVADYTKTKKGLVDNTYVDTKVGGVRQELESHIEDLLNPHQVTKGQIGLGNVDNTADLDKPVSNSTQATIISAVAPKADKTYVDNQLAVKSDKTYVDAQDLSLQSQIDQKATAEYLDNALTEQTNTVNTALSNLSTVASKFYPTLVAANTDIANIAVNQVVTIGEAVNGGLWYKDASGSTSLTKSAYDPLTQAKEAIIQNLLFDPFNETVLLNKDDSEQGYQNAEFSTLTENTGAFGKTVLSQASNAHLRRYFDVKKMGLKIGDKIYVRILCNFAAPDSASRATLYFRNSPLDTVAFQGQTPVAGTNDLIFELIMSSAANYLMIELSGVGAKSLIASSASFLPNPKFVYGASPPKISRTASDAKQKALDNEIKVSANAISIATSAKNVLPDPFFRLYSGGVRVDGLSIVEESAVIWSLVDYTTSPFNSKKAIFVSAGGVVNSYKRFNRLCAKVGDTLSVKCSIVAKSSGSFQLGAYVRNSVGTVIGTTAATTFALIADQYAEIVHTITITQAMIDGGFNLNIRFNVSNSSFPSGYYILGCVGHLNNTTQKINDTDQNNDELRLMIRELQNQIGVDVPHMYGQYYLRETHERLMRRKLGENARLSVLIIGDSWTQTAARWVLPFTNSLVASYGDGGGGWVGFGAVSNGSSNANRNARTSYTMDKTGTWTETYSSSSSVSPDLCHSTSTIAGSKIQCNAPNTPLVTGVDLYYIGTADGVIRYRFNAGSWNEISLNTATVGTLGIAALLGWTTAYHQLEIEVVSGTVRLCGLNWKSETNGVVVHKLGASGSQAAHWASTNAIEFQKGIASFNPNLAIIMLGTNDQGANRTAAQFKSDIGAIIDRVRSASTATDIFVVMPCENNRVNSIPMMSYTSEIYQLCKTKKVAFLDLQKDFGDDPSEYSSTSSKPWMMPDLIHPNSTYKSIVAAILKFIS